jgi:2-polyprenyl-3-methyl-5-hydroxy-6-metoxy-1,4-benzoquinol methylase
VANRSWIVALVIALMSLAGLAAQAPQDDETVWKSFMAWFRSAPPAAGNPVAVYGATLKAAGASDDEIKRQSSIVLRMLMSGRTDWVETYYDKAFARPLTGKPERDGYTTDASAVVMNAIKGLAPGRALDAGMGQGRNAVYLARRGWTVTGFDLSGEAVKAAAANAAAAGVRLEAVKASYADFDFGTAKWDLIVLTFAWAPMTDPAFVAKLRASLRPNGRLVFEHFLDDPDQPRPPAMHALAAGQLRRLLEGFRIDYYEEFEGIGDWGGPGSWLVRAVAVKASQAG